MGRTGPGRHCMNIVNKEHYGGQSVQMQSYAMNVGKHMIIYMGQTTVLLQGQIF